MLKIFQMDDCEWWIGDATVEEMMAAMDEEYGEQDRTFGDPPHELCEEELDLLQYSYDENDPKVSRSFREQLALEDHSDPTPRMFASTEW